MQKLGKAEDKRSLFWLPLGHVTIGNGLSHNAQYFDVGSLHEVEGAMQWANLNSSIGETVRPLAAIQSS